LQTYLCGANLSVISRQFQLQDFDLATSTNHFSLAAARDAKPPDSTNAQRAESDPKPPTHPVTEEQLRAYFAVCHIATVNRPLIHEKLEAQRRQLPEWYPRTVWDEIEKAIEAIDLPWVALPTYQKYMSENDVQFLTRFMATPQGQKLLVDFWEANIRAQHAGVTPLDAHNQRLWPTWQM
jgi:hypothetical protein